MLLSRKKVKSAAELYHSRPATIAYFKSNKLNHYSGDYRPIKKKVLYKIACTCFWLRRLIGKKDDSFLYLSSLNNLHADNVFRAATKRRKKQKVSDAAIKPAVIHRSVELNEKELDTWYNANRELPELDDYARARNWYWGEGGYSEKLKVYKIFNPDSTKQDVLNIIGPKLGRHDIYQTLYNKYRNTNEWEECRQNMIETAKR